MKENFDAALKLVLVHEGGYVDNPHDPGGATNLGVTIGTLSAHRGHKVTKMDVRNLSVAEAGEIYRKKYWTLIGGDALPSGLDYCVFDAAVNSGPTRALSWLRASGNGSPLQRIGIICDLRLAFLKSLPTWPTFGKGWTARVTDVRNHAIVMSKH